MMSMMMKVIVCEKKMLNTEMMTTGMNIAAISAITANQLVSTLPFDTSFEFNGMVCLFHTAICMNTQ